MMTIAKWMEMQRHQLGLTQAELGELVGCSQQRIQNYEKDKRCPDLELLMELAKVFQSELRIGIQGIEAQSLTKTVRFTNQTLGEVLTADGVDDVLVETTQQLLEAKIKPLLQGIHSPTIGFRFGGHRLTMSEWQTLKESPLELALLGRELETLAEAVINDYEGSDEDCDPHELGGLGDFACEVSFQTVDLEASVTVSLHSEATTHRSWNWYLFSEVESVVDEAVFSAPVGNYSGAEILRVLVDIMEELLSLPALETVIREHCQTELIHLMN